MSSSELHVSHDKPTGIMQVWRNHHHVHGQPDDILKLAYQIIEAVRAQKSDAETPFFITAPIDYMNV